MKQELRQRSAQTTRLLLSASALRGRYRWRSLVVEPQIVMRQRGVRIANIVLEAVRVEHCVKSKYKKQTQDSDSEREKNMAAVTAARRALLSPKMRERANASERFEIDSLKKPPEILVGK